MHIRILGEKISNSPNVPWDNTMKKSLLGLASFQIQWHLLDAQEKSERNISLFQGEKVISKWCEKPKPYRFNIPREE